MAAIKHVVNKRSILCALAYPECVKWVQILLYFLELWLRTKLLSKLCSSAHYILNFVQKTLKFVHVHQLHILRQLVGNSSTKPVVRTRFRKFLIHHA